MRSVRVAVMVAQLEQEVVELRARAAEQDKREAEIARRMYRRGYLAGRAAARRSAPAVTNPERHARGWAREKLTMP